MARIMHGCRWVGAAVSIWLGVAGTVQARVFLLEDPYDSREQVVSIEQAVAEFKGCRTSEAGLEKLLPLLKQRQPADFSPPARIAMASPVRAVRFSFPLTVGVGY